MANFQIPAPPSGKRPVDTYQWLGKILEALNNTKGVDWHTNNILTIKELGDSIGNDRNFVSTVDNKITTAFQPVAIKASTDLNTLTTTGLYTSDSDGNAQTITNKPTGITTGFILQVYPIWGSGTSKRLVQLLYSRQNGVLYMRSKAEDDVWTSWINVITSADVTSTNNANKVVQRDASGNFSAGTITASLNGNASTATTLQTARTINGTSFNGSANITTANWGTARNITIGNTKKSVNGSADVSWSLSEIGVAAASHTHTSSQITDATNANTANMIVKRDGSGNFSAGTITASLSGNATTATTLQTARTINGTSFNGSANITTANWGTARTITIGNSGKSVNGSANVSWSLNEIGAAEGYSVSATTAATAGWYRIAQTTSTDQDTVIGNFIIRAKVSGKHSTTNIISGISYGNNPVLQQLSHTQYKTTGISKVRLVYHTTHNGNKVYLEVYVPDATARTITVKLEDYYGWSLVSPSTAGSVPTDYRTVELTLSSNRIVSNITGSVSGNATTATTLQTARTINGTSFDGSANITTANWGTARTLTIGNTGKSVNGSANVSWSLSEIGAVPHVKYTTVTDFNNINTTGIYSCGAKSMTNAPTTNHGTLIVDFNVGTPFQIWIPDNSHIIYKRTYTTSSSTWSSWTSTLANSISGNATTATTLQTARTINGTSFNGSANITTANWGTARTITIGSTGKSVNGSGNVSWSLSEIGAAAASHTHTSSQITDATNANTANMIVKRDASGNFSAGTITASLSGNASTATTLQTARTINGTSFNGSANITTANWGTARTLTIGNTGKSVNGSGNVSWSLSEIGASPVENGVQRWNSVIKCATWSRILYLSENNVVGHSGIMNIQGTRDSVVFNVTLLITASHSSKVSIAQLNNTSYSNLQIRGIVNDKGAVYIEVYDNVNSATNTTSQTLNISYINLSAVGIGTITKYTSFTDGTTIPSGFKEAHKITTVSGNNYVGNASTATTLQTARTINGTSFNGSANITTANWGTARTLTIGNSGKSVNGSGNVSWSLSEIGAAAASHTHTSSQITDATNANTANMIVKRDASGNFSAGTITASLNGNASTATTLQTARTINGTSFNGSSNITTANWGTARTITIGNTGKSVNGSGNVSWSLSEIGAAAASHTHSYLPLSGGSISSSSFGPLIIERTESTYAASIGFKNTNGVLGYIGMGSSANEGLIRFSADTKSQYNVLDTGNFKSHVTPSAIGAATSSHNHNYAGSSSAGGNANAAVKLATARTINGTSFDGSANITTANWGTARTLTIGNTGKSVNGSGNVSWSLSEIGAAAASHTHSNYVSTTDYTLTTITKTLTITTSWQDTGITGTNLKSGSYMIQVSGMSSDATSMWNEIFTGVMSWTDATTNSTDYDEIILHKAGHASNGRAIYLRTIRSSSSGYLKLQIAASTNFTSTSVTFKFRKLI